MFCHACGTQIPDQSKFCPSCGVSLLQQQAVTTSIPVQPVANAASKAPLSKKSKLLILVGAVVILCAVVFFVLLAGKTAKYKEAMTLMESGQTQQALDSFTALKNYRDSQTYATQCQSYLTYEQAAARKADEQYAEAASIFASLGDFEDAVAQAEECRDSDAYQTALSLKESNQLEQAYEAFVQLGTFRDSADLAAQCRVQMDYDAACTFMQAKEYRQALNAFLALGAYEDSTELAQTCKNNLDYAAAEAALSQNKFYTAYELFSAMPDFSDSQERARLCIQETPKTGEQYRSSDFSKKTCPITIKTPDDGLNTYLKFYSDDNELVSCIFIEAGKSARVSLPAGNYQIKQATGKKWFGEAEMYGTRDASYYILTFGNGVMTTSLERNYTYTLTLRNAQDGNIGADSVDPGSF